MPNYYIDARGRRRRARTARAGLIPSSVRDAAQREAREIAAEVLAEIRAHTGQPRDITGALRAGYEIQIDAEGNPHITNEIFYWYFQEFGTQNMRANPVVQPALDAVRARRWWR